MNASDTEYRVVGATAALGGLVVMMCAVPPSPTAIGWGLAGLTVFAASRLAMRRRATPPAQPEPMVEAPRRIGPEPATVYGCSLLPVQGAVRSQPVYLSKVAIGRMPRSAPHASSVLPPSRASRAAKPSGARPAAH